MIFFSIDIPKRMQLQFCLLVKSKNRVKFCRRAINSRYFHHFERYLHPYALLCFAIHFQASKSRYFWLRLLLSYLDALGSIFGPAHFVLHMSPKNKSKVVRSEDRGGQWFGTPLPIHNCVKIWFKKHEHRTGSAVRLHIAERKCFVDIYPWSEWNKSARDGD